MGVHPWNWISATWWVKLGIWQGSHWIDPMYVSYYITYNLPKDVSDNIVSKNVLVLLVSDICFFGSGCFGQFWFSVGLIGLIERMDGCMDGCRLTTHRHNLDHSSIELNILEINLFHVPTTSLGLTTSQMLVQQVPFTCWTSQSDYLETNRVFAHWQW